MVFCEKNNSDVFLSVVGNDKKVFLFDIVKNKTFADFTALTYVNDVAFIKEKNSFICSMDCKEIITKDLREKKQTIIFFRGHRANNFAACQINENFFATSGEDGQVIIWDMRNGTKCFNQFQCERPLYSLRFSKQKNILISLQAGMQVDFFDLKDSIVKRDSLHFFGITTGIDINENGDTVAIGVNEISPGIFSVNI